MDVCLFPEGRFEYSETDDCVGHVNLSGGDVQHGCLGGKWIDRVWQMNLSGGDVKRVPRWFVDGAEIESVAMWRRFH